MSGSRADDDRVPVAIWLVGGRAGRSASGRRRRGVGRGRSLFAQRTAERAEQVAGLTAPWLERLRQLDEEAAASTTSPVVWATLPAG